MTEKQVIVNLLQKCDIQKNGVLSHSSMSPSSSIEEIADYLYNFLQSEKLCIKER